MTKGFTDASRWANVKLEKETEHAAALATLNFLKRVKAVAEKAATLVGPDATAEHLVVDFGDFDAKHLDFVIATLASGEARISAESGKIKAEETSITGLWRVEVEGSQKFIFASIPEAILNVVKKGERHLPIPEGAPEGVFSSPAIIKELSAALDACNLDALDFDPPHTTELTRQPIEKADMTWIKSVLGTGGTEIWLSGFANARMQSTGYCGIWRSTLLNKAGKTLLDSFVVALLPPEVPASPDEFEDSVRECEELIEWLENDLARGVL